MIDAGDVAVADLRRETRWRVLVVSSARFNRLSERAIVVPEFRGPSAMPAMPWHVAVDGSVYAVESLLSVEQGSLLDVVGRATAVELERVRRALGHITT